MLAAILFTLTVKTSALAQELPISKNLVSKLLIQEYTAQSYAGATEISFNPVRQVGMIFFDGLEKISYFHGNWERNEIVSFVQNGSTYACETSVEYNASGQFFTVYFVNCGHGQAMVGTDDLPQFTPIYAYHPSIPYSHALQLAKAYRARHPLTPASKDIDWISTGVTP